MAINASAYHRCLLTGTVPPTDIQLPGKPGYKKSNALAPSSPAIDIVNHSLWNQLITPTSRGQHKLRHRPL